MTLHLFGSSTRGLVAEDVTFPCAPGLLSEADGYEVTPVDDYLSARSATALSWAFGTVVDRSLGIVYTAPASAGPGDDRPGGSRVTVSDQVGAGMQVSRVSGIVYGDKLLDGALAAQAVEISLADPGDIEATHEFGYLVEAMNSRYNLGYAVYDLFYDALEDGQFSYASADEFSNRASWYVNSAHEMVPMGGEPFAFATQDEVNAISDGRWEERASEDVRDRIEAAQAAGATAVCETYYYIGNLPNQYTGGDVTLYDFVVMVETDLASGSQTLLLSIPVEAVPARRASVTVAADGSATMALDGGQDVRPLRLAYVVSPTPDVDALLDRADAGEEVSDAEIEAATGSPVQRVDGRAALFASAFSGTGASAEAGTTAAAWAAQTNSLYAFSRDTPLFAKSGDAYVPLTTLPVPGQTYYCERTIYAASFPTADTVAFASVEKVMEPYTVALDADQVDQRFVVRDGQCVALAGTPKYAGPLELASVDKKENVTGSAPYAKLSSIAEVTDGAVRLTATLGNNGALLLGAASEEPDPTPVPDPDPEPTPEPEPEPTPEPEPEPTPEPEPEPDPEPNPEPTPEPTPEPEPDPNPDPSPEPKPTPDEQAPADESSDTTNVDGLPAAGDATSLTVLLALVVAGVLALVAAWRRRH